MAYIIFLSCVWANEVVSAEKNILVLKTNDREQYNIAVEGIKEVLDSSKKDSFKLYIHNLKTKKHNKKVIKLIKQNNVDLIITLGNDSINFLKDAHPDLPIIYTMTLKFEQTENDTDKITGVSLTIPPGIWFETIIKIIPDLYKIGIIYNPANTGRLVELATKKANDLGLITIPVEVKSPSDIKKALNTIRRKADILWTVADSTVLNNLSLKHILTYTLENKIPFITLSSTVVRAGALLSLSSNYKDIGRQTGRIALKILSGSNPADIPVTGPKEIVLSVNLNTANILNIDIPNSILKKAQNIFSTNPYTIYLKQ